MGTETLTITQNDWVIPASDRRGIPVIKQQSTYLFSMTDLCEKKELAVQAGGNVGYYPMVLSWLFDAVISFEPDPTNFYCLEQNVGDLENVSLHQLALGDIEDVASMENPEPDNCGTPRLVTGGGVDVVTLDSFDLPALDFLQLDIEGYEYFALKGAKKTIKKYSPVIVVELKGHGEQYGHSDEELVALLSRWGYNHRGTLGRDYIFTRN